MRSEEAAYRVKESITVFLEQKTETHGKPREKCSNKSDRANLPKPPLRDRWGNPYIEASASSNEEASAADNEAKPRSRVKSDNRRVNSIPKRLATLLQTRHTEEQHGALGRMDTATAKMLST